MTRGKWCAERGSLIYIAFLYFAATIRKVLGVVMKYFFLLYLVARGDGGVNRLEVLVYNNSRLFLWPPRKNNPWRATILEGLVSTIRHGRNILLIYISFLDYAFYKAF